MYTSAMSYANSEREIDLALAGSFPASDPPPWTLGVTPSEPAADGHRHAGVSPAAIDVVIAAGRGRRRAATISEAMALTALVPVGVVVAAAPFLLVVWAFGAAAAWWLGR